MNRCWEHAFTGDACTDEDCGNGIAGADPGAMQIDGHGLAFVDSLGDGADGYSARRLGVIGVSGCRCVASSSASFVQDWRVRTPRATLAGATT